MKEEQMFIAVSDLTAFAKFSSSITELELFAIVSDYYEYAGGIIESAGGEIIKYMGDSFLFVFPQDRSDAAAEAILELKQSGDAWMSNRGMPCRHIVKLHFGKVVLGYIGTKDRKKKDIYGEAVNKVFLLDSKGIALSAECFRKLSSDMRKHFKKHTPPISYLPIEAHHH